MQQIVFCVQRSEFDLQFAVVVAVVVVVVVVVVWVRGVFEGVTAANINQNSTGL